MHDQLAADILQKITEQPTPTRGDHDRARELLDALTRSFDLTNPANLKAAAAILAREDLAAEIAADPDRLARLQHAVDQNKESMRSHIRKSKQFHEAREALNGRIS